MCVCGGELLSPRGLPLQETEGFSMAGPVSRQSNCSCGRGQEAVEAAQLFFLRDADPPLPSIQLLLRKKEKEDGFRGVISLTQNGKKYWYLRDEQPKGRKTH